MKSSCIQRPPDNHYIQVYEWQVQFCQSNHCAAFVLAHFIAWHDWKFHHDDYYRRANNIAELHGDGRPHDQNAYLFFSIEEISEGILGTYGKNSIINALQILKELEAISIHKNPNPRYHFDKTKYFIFNPDACNAWLVKNYPTKSKCSDSSTQPFDNLDRLKINDRSSEIKPPPFENKRPSFKKGRAITDTTNNPTNKNKSINPCERFIDDIKKNEADIQLIIDSLTDKGFPVKRFHHPDSIGVIQHLYEAGATVELFLKAYEKALSATETSGFGVSYLAKVVDGMLRKKFLTSKNQSSSAKSKGRVFENYIPDDLDWINGDS